MSSQSQDSIRTRILNNINSPVSKIQGSDAWNIVSPTSLELAQQYTKLDQIRKKVFIKDGYDENLDIRVNEFGVYRKEGTRAVGEVIFEGSKGTRIGNGTIIYFNDLQYVVIKDIVLSSDIEDNKTPVEALSIGSRYNIMANTEFKVLDDIMNIKKIYNESNFEGGTEIETDDELRERYKLVMDNVATSGNEAHYKIWAMEVQGVYNAQVTPRWNGGGTVKILIYGQNNQAVDDTVLQRCIEHIESQRPTGAEIAVVTPKPFDIIVSATLKVQEGYSIENIREQFILTMNEYSIENRTEIVYLKVLSIILGIEGVHDLSNLLINGDSKNIVLDDESIPTYTNVVFIEEQN